jgi:hypothetical protein
MSGVDVLYNLPPDRNRIVVTGVCEVYKILKANQMLISCFPHITESRFLRLPAHRLQMYEYQ